MLAITLLLLLACPAAAGQGPKSAGEVAETPPMSVDVARALAISEGGKLVVGGVSRKGSRWAAAIARYRADGRLDESFGNRGRVLRLISSADLGPLGVMALASQPDGKVVAASGAGFALARYTARGRLDPSFGGNGRVLTDFRSVSAGGNSFARTVAIAADGKIVAGGWTGSPLGHFAIARYTARGRLDASFGAGGKVVLADLTAVSAVAVEPDGKIIALGWMGQPKGFPVGVVLRLTTGGELDPSFGQDGKAIVDSLVDVTPCLLLQPDGKIVVAGNLGLAAHNRAVLVRYTGAGTLDPSFGSGGQVVSDGPEAIIALALEPDRKLVVAAGVGQWPPEPSVEGDGLILARYRQNGSLDPSFGDSGTVPHALPLGAVAVQGDGKIVTAGNREGDFVVARYTKDGLDTRFGSSGSTVTAFGPAWGTKLASLSATRAGRGVLVRWRTTSELDLRGFYLYREQNGVRHLVNRGLIRAKGAGLAASYAFHDRRAEPSIRRYWLQEITVDSNLRWFGPATVAKRG